MKNNYYLFTVLVFLCANLINAQFSCPQTLGPQSSTTTIHFKITSGTCGDYPDIIEISDGIYNQNWNKISCNGTNLKYSTGAPPLPNALSFTATFPNLGICPYVNGSLAPLSNNDKTLNESVSIYPNPLIKANHLTLKFARSLSAKLLMYDVTGKLAFRDEVTNINSKKINISALTNGIYFLRIATEDAYITRKIIIMN